MRLLVFGGTGLTGKEVVEQALEAGHSVTAVVRNPEKVTTTHENLKVSQFLVHSSPIMIDDT